MNFRSLVLATTLALVSAASQAALVTLSPPEWPPVPSTGLETVQFNRVSNADGQMVALGAHGYKNGPTLPNDGIKVFTALPGTYPGTPDRANWSFDFSYNLGNCSTCGVYLRVDTNPGAGTSFSELQLNASPFAYGLTGNDSWNLEMSFFNVLLSYDFNPFTSSSTAFELVIRNAAGGPDVLSTDILVNVNAVPEPGSMALLGLGLAGLAVLRRRRT